MNVPSALISNSNSQNATECKLSDILIILALIIALVSAFTALGFKLGRNYEQKFWIKYYHEEMTKLCMDCAGIREELNERAQ